MAAHTLTSRLISAGHKNISIFANNLWQGAHLEQVIAGHTKAMSDAGLDVNTASIDFTKSLPPQDLAGIKNFLEKFPETTGILSLTIDNAYKIVEYADLMNIKIPEDLSIASLQAGFMRAGYGKAFTGIIYDWIKILKLCQQILFADPKKIPVSRYEFYFTIDPKGQSIGTPKKGEK